MVSHHQTKSGGRRYCDCGKIMFLVVEGQDSTCPRLNYHAAKYDGHRRYGSGNDAFSS